MNKLPHKINKIWKRCKTLRPRKPKHPKAQRQKAKPSRKASAKKAKAPFPKKPPKASRKGTAKAKTTNLGSIIEPEMLLGALKLNTDEKKIFTNLSKNQILSLTEVYNKPQQRYNKLLHKVNNAIENVYKEKHSIDSSTDILTTVPNGFVTLVQVCNEVMDLMEMFAYRKIAQRTLWSQDTLYMMCLNKLRKTGVYMPQNERLTVRLFIDESGMVLSADMDACVKCKGVAGGVLDFRPVSDCVAPTAENLIKIIKRVKGKYNHILIPISLYETPDGCTYAKENGEIVDLHANALLLDMKKKTLRAFDPNTMEPMVQECYVNVFSKVVKDMQDLEDVQGKKGKKWEYIESSESCMKWHNGLCAYAVIPTALGIKMSIKQFMQYVVDILKCRRDRLLKKSLLKKVNQYQAAITKKSIMKTAKKGWIKNVDALKIY